MKSMAKAVECLCLDDTTDAESIDGYMTLFTEVPHSQSLLQTQGYIFYDCRPRVVLRGNIMFDSNSISAQNCLHKERSWTDVEFSRPTLLTGLLWLKKLLP